MNETSKASASRNALGHDRYLAGNGIDIGAGRDPLQLGKSARTVRAWDKADGDAMLMAGVADGSFDFVYSSHCLEHLVDVVEALRNWVRILRSGGHLYVVVPDYLLYEKLNWPSRFNCDHKHSFSLEFTRDRVGRSNHWHVENNLTPLLEFLGVEVLDKRLQDDGYDYSNGLVDQTRGQALSQIAVVGRKR